MEPREEGARGAPDLAGAVDSAGAVAGGVAGVISPRMSARSMWTRLGRSLLPRAWWPGAIFQKEMRVQGRRYFTYLTRGVTALLLAGITALIFMAMVDFGFNGASYSGGTAMRLQELQGLAPGVSVTVFLIQLIGMTLAAPILLGPSLCDEKRAGTLSALLTTPLSAWQIVFGKLLSAFSQLTILALIPMPLVLAVRVFGGVPAEFVFAGLSVSYSMAFLCGSLAIFYSTGSKRGLTAATLAALTAIALHAFPALMMAKLISWGVKVWPGMPVLMSTPATTAIMIADLFSGGPTGPWSVRSVWVANSVVNTGLGALTLVFATARVRALLRREGEGTTAAAETGAGAGKTKGGGKERSGSREVGARPVMWRELRQRMFRRRFWAVAATAVASTFLVLVNWDDLTSRGPAMAVTIGGTALALLLATAGSAGSVNGEREARTWDVLLTTGVSAWEVVLGKWTGSMKRLMFVPLVILVQQVVSVGAG
ncbi:MAG: ABC transporter permease subunit, partial [Phycisphaerae bacterium]|nr:ABC transporter permease subunit [Phycisphaerae bacterium]